MWDERRPWVQYGANCNSWGTGHKPGGFFIFLFFIFVFYKNIFLFSKFTGVYTPASLLPGGRHLVAPPRGGRGFSIIFNGKNLCANPWRTGRPTAGRPAPQAARQRGDRLPEAAGPRLLHQKFRKKFSVCCNTIHITYNGLTVHWYCKNVLILQGSINEVWVQNMKTKTTGP